MMSIKEKIVLIVIALILIIPIIINEIKEYNLRELKKETLEISKILKNNYNEITEVGINKEIKGIKTRGEGKAFIDDEDVIVILSYKEYCSVKIPTLEEVSLSKSKCPNLKLINGEIIEIE